MIGNNYHHLQKAMPYLNEYARKKIHTKISNKGKMHDVIEIVVNPISIAYHEIHISDLLAGMGYTITSDEEKIIIE